MTDTPAPPPAKRVPGTPWPKGRSGNPSGKSKTQLLTQALRAELTQNPARVRTIADKLIQLAEAGDMEATRLVFDRLEGKAVQAIEMTTTVTHLTPEERRQRIIELQARVVSDLTASVEAADEERDATPVSD